MAIGFVPWQRGIGLAMALLLSAKAAGAGDLDRAGNEARHGIPAASEPPERPGHHPHHHGHADGDSGALGELLAPVFYYVVLSPWYIPNQAVEADRAPDAALRTRFADYPYADGVPGLLLDPGSSAMADDPVGDAPPLSRQVVAAQLALEAGLSGATRRDGVRARLQFPLRFELDSDWSRYQELDGGNLDVTWWGREHVSFRFAESSSIQFRSGIGPQHWLDAKGWVHGADLTWGFEAFPGRPWVLAFEASGGVLGKAFAAGLTGRIGVMLGPVEIDAGWRQRWVGNVPLGGAFVSAQLWL
jgi:hypothetical protein